MSEPSPMVPNLRWSEAVKQFDQVVGGQQFLCVRCILMDGNTTPPDQILINNGQTICLEHFMAGTRG